MFNAPRAQPRYGVNPTGGFGGSFVDENPLSVSVYDTVDPWSATPSPTATPAPAANNSVFSSVIADATVPAIYNQSFQLVDTTNSGEVSVSSLSRVLGTSNLPAGTIDKIVNLVSSKPRVSKLEFFVALALVALAQEGKDVSIEQVAALSSQNTLPEPTLDLNRLPPSTSTFSPINYRQNTATSFTPDDPWNTNSRVTPGFDAPPPLPSSLSGTGLPSYWWKKQETVNVTLLGPQGFILNRYMVYEITSSRGAPVSRRYSEFVFVWECLLRRYPFRLFPSLPPKRIGGDEVFLEQRRRGLARSLNFVLNHPVIKEDALLAAFLTEPSFELWRKNTPVSLDEESVSKRVDRNEEMTIPSDLEEKLAILRRRINPLIEQWQRICILAERIIKRREAAAVRIPPAFRPDALQAHFTLPIFSSSSSSSSDSEHSPSLLDSIMFTTHLPPQQGDMARLTNTLRAVVEVNEQCWRGDDCELSSGVRSGLQQVAAHAQRHSELSELRTRALYDTTLEQIKAQRDLYIAVKDLLIRNDRLSIDQVERLKQRVEATSLKMEGVKVAQKEGWQDEVERQVASIERDKATIAAQLSRRVFIRACLWHELRVVLHNRENASVSQMIQTFAQEEQVFSENVTNTWTSLNEAVEVMPFE
ncbi:Sorting nexin [Mycena indigotica]|uniref:Sorting nexin MVP1 n=1 Tax=Mycena indigotica TaxID=2126181 RepID=A0A8H6T2G9_9AGAR|nr:Sorting nexin [Mycena indigotica]KAF7309773.1 Sorting nexin [Mycena indigotica]